MSPSLVRLTIALCVGAAPSIGSADAAIDLQLPSTFATDALPKSELRCSTVTRPEPAPAIEGPDEVVVTQGRSVIVTRCHRALDPAEKELLREQIGGAVSFVRGVPMGIAGALLGKVAPVMAPVLEATFRGLSALGQLGAGAFAVGAAAAGRAFSRSVNR